ncbi:MAG: hypothetical protein H0V89_07850 [Deltaproteobacteria bacterium]|nr:hypothetical protein [Deltaproteobacteria bacterium]
MICALLLAVAHAGSPEAWIAVGDAQVLEALGEEQAAAEIYVQLGRQLPGEDPVRAEALYRLGRLLRRLGEIEPAIRAFDDCVRSRSFRARCLGERTEIEIERSAIRQVPTRWTFDDTAHGLIHSWSDEHGSIRIAVPVGDEDPALLWSDAPIRGDTDTLIVGFALEEDAVPERVRFEARALVGPGMRLRFQAEDLDGRRFTSLTPLTVDATPRVIEVRLEDLVGDGDSRIDPRDLHRLRLVDERATERAGGEATLVIDTFEVL